MLLFFRMPTEDMAAAVPYMYHERFEQVFMEGIRSSAVRGVRGYRLRFGRALPC